MDALLEHLRVYRSGAGRQDFLFFNARDRNLLRSEFVRDVLGKSAKRAGFAGRRVTPLTLRHTAASLMFDAGLTALPPRHQVVGAEARDIRCDLSRSAQHLVQFL